MTYALATAKKEAFTALKKHLGKKFSLSTDMLTAPAANEDGDLTFSCLTLAKGLGRDAGEVATELAAKIGPTKYIAKITAVASNICFSWNNEAFASAVISDILRLKKRYGYGQTGKGKRILIDYARLSATQPLSLSEAGNLALGQALTNLLRTSGYEVIPVVCVQGLDDHLRHVFKLWHLDLKKIYNESDLEEQAQAIVNKLLTEGLARASEDGVTIDVSAEGLGTSLLRQADGTLLYNAKALALEYQKEQDYAGDRSLYVVSHDEPFSALQLGATLARMQVPREVTQVDSDPASAAPPTLETTRDFLLARYPHWSTRTLNKVTATLHLAALRFQLLSPTSSHALSDLTSLLHPEPVNTPTSEQIIIRLLADFPDVVMQASLTYQPAHLVHHLLSLAQLPPTALQDVTATVLKNGLALLGLTLPKEI